MGEDYQEILRVIQRHQKTFPSPSRNTGNSAASQTPFDQDVATRDQECKRFVVDNLTKLPANLSDWQCVCTAVQKFRTDQLKSNVGLGEQVTTLSGLRSRLQSYHDTLGGKLEQAKLKQEKQEQEAKAAEEARQQQAEQQRLAQEEKSRADELAKQLKEEQARKAREENERRAREAAEKERLERIRQEKAAEEIRKVEEDARKKQIEIEARERFAAEEKAREAEQKLQEKLVKLRCEEQREFSRLITIQREDDYAIDPIPEHFHTKNQTQKITDLISTHATLQQKSTALKARAKTLCDYVEIWDIGCWIKTDATLADLRDFNQAYNDFIQERARYHMTLGDIIFKTLDHEHLMSEFRLSNVFSPLNPQELQSLSTAQSPQNGSRQTLGPAPEVKQTPAPMPTPLNPQANGLGAGQVQGTRQPPLLQHPVAEALHAQNSAASSVQNRSQFWAQLPAAVHPSRLLGPFAQAGSHHAHAARGVIQPPSGATQPAVGLHLVQNGMSHRPLQPIGPGAGARPNTQTNTEHNTTKVDPSIGPK